MGFFGKDEDEQIRSYERSLARAKEETETLDKKNKELELKINEANKSKDELKQEMEVLQEHFEIFKKQSEKEKQELQAKLKGERLIKKNVKRVFVQLKVTPDLKNTWIKLAEKRDISLSKLIREAVLHYQSDNK